MSPADKDALSMSAEQLADACAGHLVRSGLPFMLPRARALADRLGSTLRHEMISECLVPSEVAELRAKVFSDELFNAFRKGAGVKGLEQPRNDR